MAVTVTRVRPGAPTGARDEQGNPVLTASTETELEVLAFAPAASEETVEAFGPEVVDAGTLYDRNPIDLTASDLVIINGATYQVEGHVRPWRSPYNPVADGDEVLVRRAS